MKIHFYSFTDGKKSVSYQADATYDGKCYEFIDKSTPNTMIRFYLESNSYVRIVRIGDVNSEMKFVENEITSSVYQSKELNFEYQIKSYDFKINENSISFSYDYFYENECVGKIKIALLIKNDLKKSKL